MLVRGIAVPGLLDPQSGAIRYTDLDAVKPAVLIRTGSNAEAVGNSQLPPQALRRRYNVRRCLRHDQLSAGHLCERFNADSYAIEFREFIL